MDESKEERVAQIKTLSIREENLNKEQRKAVKALSKECFGDVDQQEIEEDFIAENFARVLAYFKNRLVGQLSLYKREVEFDGKKIVLGGEGGVCVTEGMRGLGIGKKLVSEGLEELKKQGCDLSCLGVDLEKQAYKLYENLGYKFMNRDIAFENIRGEIKHSDGIMFIPLNSPEVYEEVMNSKNTFNIGKGYW